MRAIASAGLLLAVLLLSAEAAMACSSAPFDSKQAVAESEGAVTARLLVARPSEPVSSVAPTDFVYRTGRVVKGCGTRAAARTSPGGA